jgi:hypothetical protein
MATPKRTAGRAKAPAPEHAPTLVVKGLSAAEVAALDAITERRREALASQGGTTSRNAVIVSLLREAIAREAAP